MSLTRTTILSSLMVNIPNEYNGTGSPLAVSLASIQTINDDSGGRIGHPTQTQQPAIASDFTPEVLAALNAQLAYLGLALTPVGQSQNEPAQE